MKLKHDCSNLRCTEVTTTFLFFLMAYYWQVNILERYLDSLFRVDEPVLAILFSNNF